MMKKVKKEEFFIAGGESRRRSLRSAIARVSDS